MNTTVFPPRELSSLCLSLAHLLGAGLTAGDALSLLAQDAPAAQKPLFSRLAARADAGLPLAQVLEDSGAFPADLCVMTAAGGRTGRTEEALLALADHYEARARLEEQLRSALLQPVLMAGLLALVLCLLLGWVLPVFDQVYRQLGTSLTGLAGVLLAVGKGIRALWPLLLLLAVGAALLLRRKSKSPALLNDPDARTARLTQVLALALRSGLDGEAAMALAVKLGEEGSDFRQNCHRCLTLLQGQAPLPQALLESGLLPAADCRLLEAGFRSGRLDAVMTRLAEQSQLQFEERSRRRLERIEPAIVLSASLLVGLILLAVLLPLTGIMAAIG